MSVHHGWVGDPALFVAVHLPERAALGVVICPPLAQEGVSAYRTLRLLAERLEARGVAAVRFDAPGRGESAPVAETGAVLGGAREAAELLRRAGCARIAYLGLASGAFAASAAAEPGDLLVLWDAPRSGRAWLRRQRSLAALTLGPDRVADGVETIVGMDLTEGEVAAIGAAGVAVPAGVRAVAVVRRGEQPPAEVAETVEVDGMEDLLGVSSMTSRIPADAVLTIVDRLAAEAGSGAEESPAGASAEPAPLTPPRLAAERHADGIVERLLRVGPHALFGIETAPRDPAPGAPVLLLHNGASEHRVGAADYQVLWGRELAARGVRVLRVDRRGTGESGELDLDPDDLMFTQAWIDDQDAMIEAAGVDGDRLVVAGLCVGAWLAAHAAPRRPRLVVGISQDVFRPEPAAPNEIVEYFRQVDRVTPARRRLRRAFNRFAPPRLKVLVARTRGRGDVGAHFAPLAEAGVPTVLLLSPLDVAGFADLDGPETVRRMGGAVEVIRLPSGDHSLFSRPARLRVFEELSSRVAAGAAPGAH
ncbi:MAG: alpha/beta fold hydrolase [Actinomycetales bacterium]|nr:alpha/beta fold hydrolase [Actinomycetales bacterium]